MSSSPTSTIATGALSITARKRSSLARVSSSRRRRTVTSDPLTSTMSRPCGSSTGRAVHATARAAPSRGSHQDSRSACTTPLAAFAIAMRSPYWYSGSTRSRKLRPPSSSFVQPNTCSKAGFTPSCMMTPSGSTATRKLGIASVIASRKPRLSSASCSRAFRSVMSSPPATMLTTRPCSSSTGTLRQ